MEQTLSQTRILVVDDDDIVAEQLREAAMRELDPIVREGLWNEYRKYKGIEIPEE